MNTTIAAALAFVLAPSSPTDYAPFDVADAEVETVDNAAHLVTYDADGEQTATLSVWTDDEGHAHLEADFADGLYLSAVSDGEHITIESPDAIEVSERVAIIENNIPKITDEDVMRCAGSVVVAAVGCSAGLGGGPISCLLGAGLAGRECGRLIRESRR